MSTWIKEIAKFFFVWWTRKNLSFLYKNLFFYSFSYFFEICLVSWLDCKIFSCKLPCKNVDIRNFQKINENISFQIKKFSTKKCNVNFFEPTYVENILFIKKFQFMRLNEFVSNENRDRVKIIFFRFCSSQNIQMNCFINKATKILQYEVNLLKQIFQFRYLYKKKPHKILYKSLFNPLKIRWFCDF